VATTPAPPGILRSRVIERLAGYFASGGLAYVGVCANCAGTSHIRAAYHTAQATTNSDKRLHRRTTIKHQFKDNLYNNSAQILHLRPFMGPSAAVPAISF
jgi:hypothetical protein